MTCGPFQWFFDCFERKRRWNVVPAALVLGGSLFGGPVGWGQPPERSAGPEIPALVAAADQAREGGRLQEAAELYRRLVDLQPEERRSRWFLCTTLYDLRHFDEARRQALQLTERWPDFGPGHAVLGLALFQLGDYGAALERFQQARIRGFGKEAELQRVTRYFGALALNRLGRFEAAYQALRGFAYENRRSPGILNAFGLCMLRLTHLPDEIPEEMRQLVRRVGEATFAWESGSREQAKQEIGRILQEYPEVPHLHYSWGVLLLSSNPSEALNLFLRELEITPTHLPALVEAALEHIRRGEYEQARPFAERACQVDPASFAGPYLLGQVLLETGSPAEALVLLEQAVRLAPSRPETHFALGRAYQRVGRREDAQRELREFERLRTLMKDAEEFLTRQDYSVTREPEP